MFKWLNASITRKVSSLSFILLSFLFIVIIYSVFKLQQINHDMQEVAQIDVPLTEVIADIEVLQLKQHLLMEKIRQQGARFFENEAVKDKSLVGFYEYNTTLSAQLNKAMDIIQSGLKFDSIRVKIKDHQTLINLIRSLHTHRDTFAALVEQLFQHGATDFFAHWNDLEKQGERLDSESDLLLRKIDQLTVKVSVYAEKQEQEFMIVNAILGFSALAIGIYLTLYIVQSFRHRVGSIRWKIESLNRAVYYESEEKRPDKFNDSDEFGVLEEDLNILINRLSKERNNRYEVEKELIELATKDKLTGAYNRHKWDEQLQEELAFASRGGLLSLIMLDIDHFKKINDTHGHDMGDMVLRSLVSELHDRLRISDMLFRTGGEEFALLLRGADSSNACQLAEQIRRNVERLDHDGLPAITISLGVASYQAGDDALSIIKRADLALYAAKDGGRNQVKMG